MNSLVDLPNDIIIKILSEFTEKKHYKIMLVCHTFSKNTNCYIKLLPNIMRWLYKSPSYRRRPMDILINKYIPKIDNELYIANEGNYNTVLVFMDKSDFSNIGFSNSTKACKEMIKKIIDIRNDIMGISYYVFDIYITLGVFLFI